MPGATGSTVEVQRLVARLVGDGTSFQRMLLTAEKAAARTGARITTIGKRIEGIGKSLRGFGKRLAIGLTLPLMIIGGLGVKAFASFDQAMTESTSIMQVTAAQTTEMRNVALDLSTRAAQGPRDLARAYFYLASAGLDAEQSIAALPQMARFATAGAFDMATATDLATDAQSALGLTVKNATVNLKNLTRVTGVLVKANTLANASVQQFSVALTSKAGAALKSYNKDIEEGVALLALYADQGIKESLAGNNLARVMLLLSKSTRDSAKEHERLGFDVFDAAGKMRNFADIIKNLEDITGDMSDELKSATLEALGFEARVQAAILPLLGGSEALRRYEKELRRAGGATKDVADKQMKSFSNQMKILKNRLTVVGIEIGKTLAPMLTKLSKIVGEGINWWKQLTPEVKKAIVYWGVAAATLGPLIISLGLFVGIIGLAIKSLGLLLGAFTLLAPAIAAIGFLLSPASWLIAGIGVLIYMIGNAVGAWSSFNDVLKSVGTALKQVGTWIGEVHDVFAPTFGEIRTAITGIVDALKSGDFEGAGQIAMAGLKSAFYTGMDSILQKWGDFATNFANTLLEAYRTVATEWIKTEMLISKGIIRLWEAWDAFQFVYFGKEPTMPDPGKGYRAEITNLTQQADEIFGRAREARAGKERDALVKQHREISSRIQAITPLAMMTPAEHLIAEISGEGEKRLEALKGKLDSTSLAIHDLSKSMSKAASKAAKEHQELLRKTITDVGTKNEIKKQSKVATEALTSWVKTGWESAKEFLLKEHAELMNKVDPLLEDQEVKVKFSVEGIEALRWGSVEMLAQAEAYLAAMKGALSLKAPEGMGAKVPSGGAGLAAYNVGRYAGQAMNWMQTAGIRGLVGRAVGGAAASGRAAETQARGRGLAGADWLDPSSKKNVVPLTVRLDELIRISTEQLNKPGMEMIPAGFGEGEV